MSLVMTGDIVMYYITILCLYSGISILSSTYRDRWSYFTDYSGAFL